jgi:hypothetical protein
MFDIFSAGVVLFTFIEGIFPFSKAVKTDSYYSKIMSGNFEAFWRYSERRSKRQPPYFSEEFKNLANSMLHAEPTKRREGFKKQMEDKLSWFNSD